MTTSDIFTVAQNKQGIWYEVIPPAFTLSLYTHAYPDFVIRQLLDDKLLLDKQSRYRLANPSFFQQLLLNELDKFIDKDGYTTRIFYTFPANADARAVNNWIVNTFPQTVNYVSLGIAA